MARQPASQVEPITTFTFGRAVPRQFRGVSQLHPHLGEHPATFDRQLHPTTRGDLEVDRDFIWISCAALRIVQQYGTFAMPKAAPGGDIPAKRTTRETPSIQSLDRGLLILETVGQSGAAVSLGHLAAILGIDRSSAFRLANTLKRRGFLTNPSAGKDYILGPSVWRLSRQYDWSKMLATVAHDRLKSLAAITHETAHLAVREGRKALFIDHAATRHVIAISGQTGELVPLYCTSHGKALLSDFDLQSLNALFGSKPLKAWTQNTILSPAKLAKQCEEIRVRGYATDESEFLDGVRCIAAPIRDSERAVIASIGISAPAARFPAEREKEFAEHVTAVAAQIGKLVGSREE